MFTLYPIITRIYTKEDFSTFGIYASVVALFSMVGTSLYPTGFVIPKFKRTFYSLLKLSLFLTFSTVLILSLVIVFARPIFDFVFKTNDFGYVIYLIPIGLLLNCLRLIFLNWNVREKMFPKNAAASIGKSLSAKILQIGLGLKVGSTSVGLIGSDIFSNVINIYLLGIRKFAPKLKILKLISKEEVISGGKEYIKYPLNLLPGNLINKYTSDLPLYLLSAYFNPAFAGAFVLANQMMNIPLNVLGGSISTIFIQRSNELYLKSPGSLSDFIRSSNRRLLLLGVLAFGFIFGFGDLMFGIFFGKKWLDAGSMASFLSIFFIFRLVSSPLVGVFRVVGKEQYSLYISVILALGRSVGMYFGVNSGDVYNAILYYSIGSLCGYLVTMVLVFTAANLAIFRITFETILITSVGFFLFYLSRQCIDSFIDLKLIFNLI